VIRKRALILGCGYVGCVLARTLVREGVEVKATTRSRDRFGEIEALGAVPAIADITLPGTLSPLAEWEPDVVFDLVRPQRIGEDRYTTWGTRNVAHAFSRSPLEALVYLSSTSVYGRRNGESTDEATEIDPVSPMGRTRAEAEGVYLQLFDGGGFPVRICRVPGIYGPGRTLRQRLESGAYRRLDDDDLWISRIHVDDLAEGLVAAWLRGAPGHIYLLCDDEPVTGKEYAELTASLLSLPLPPALSREDIRHELASSAFERRISARRCSNRRMREELGVIPRYPSVRVGVAAALREEGAI
jgi:nucleoside-diphosphate-sugar epimerase